MEQNAEYHRQYRKQRGAEFERMMRSIDGKLDRILGVLAEKILEKKIVLPATLPKPVVRSEAIGMLVEKHVPNLSGIVCHSTKDSKPI